MHPSIMIAGVVVLGLGAGGGYYGMEVYPQQQFRNGLDQAFATLPPGTTASYKTAHYSVLTNQAVVTGLTVHGVTPGDTPQPFDISIDSIEAKSPNLKFPEAWAQAVANPAASAPDAALPVADDVVVKGTALHSATVNLTEASIQLAKLRIFPWALLHDGMPSWHEIQASAASRTTPAGPSDPRPIFRAEAAVFLGVAYDSYAAGPMHIKQTLPAIEADYDVHATTSGAFDRGIMQGASVVGIKSNGKALGDVEVDRVTMGVVDVRQPMTRLMNGDAWSTELLDGISIGRIEYAGVTIQPPNQAIFHFDGMSVGPVTFAHGVPVSGELGWTDIRITELQLPDPRAWEAFNSLGLETVTISFTLAYDWDIAHRRVSVHDTMLKVNELGTLTVAAELANMGADRATWDRGGLSHLKLRFVDASLVDRLLRMGAMSSGSDPADYRTLIAAMARDQLSMGGTGSAMQAIAGAAADFIASPRSLMIEFSPPGPIPFVTLQRSALTPLNLVTMPGLTVTANEP